MDPVVKSHFQSLYDAMLEKNLCRIIEPYSRVQINYVAKAINLSEVSFCILPLDPFCNYCFLSFRRKLKRNSPK